MLQRANSCLSDHDAERTGVHRGLGDKADGALLRRDRGTARRGAVTDQRVQKRCGVSDLAQHPGLQLLA